MIDTVDEGVTAPASDIRLTMVRIATLPASEFSATLVEDLLEHCGLVDGDGAGATSYSG